MKILIFCTAIFGLLISGTYAKTKENPELKALQMEKQSLEAIRSEKLELLEKAEAARWDQRYRQSEKKKEYDEKARGLESQYSRLANEMGRKQDDLLREANTVRDIRFEWEEIQARSEAFAGLISQSVDKEAEKLSLDIPAGISERTLMYSSLSEKAASGKAGAGELMDQFLRTKLDRFLMTGQQVLSSEEGLVDNQLTPVRRLRLGTVFIAEQSKAQPEKTQILLRTGKLDGQVFVWRSQLAEDFNAVLASCISTSAAGGNSTMIPLDVLQNKSLGSGFVEASGTTVRGTLLAWFRKGGLVMYPLFLAALLGLLFSLERFIVIVRHSTNPQKFMKRLAPLITNGGWKDASSFCMRSGTTLARVMCSILGQKGQSRNMAEKAVQETLLREIPLLEKRMVLLAAIGGSAPLMGLLGTVSGMISLFKVITDVGTNDPRILAGGISEALVTTQTGLVIAIPILLVHGYLSDRMERIQNDATSYSMEILNKLWPDQPSAPPARERP